MTPGVRHADTPNQTVNVDLCFVPAGHAVADAVPAVSGSSGKLIVSAAPAAAAEREWPGQVFAQAELSYPAAMEQFVAARAAAAPIAAAPERTVGDPQVARRALRRETQRLRLARAQERERRRLSDQAWKGRQPEEQAARSAVGAPKEGQRRPSWERAARRAQRQAAWAERHQELARRRHDDACWREQRQEVRQRAQALGLGRVAVWIAVLVIVDNCTRRCLGLPLFTLGAHVTAAVVVAALRALLPRDLQFLIADGGPHFTAEVMQELARRQGFVRVPLARHRPQSNGIAERFIETLKVWLAGKEWHTPEELQALLEEFLVYYNDRPHQGRELAGLSPNEYAARKLAA